LETLNCKLNLPQQSNLIKVLLHQNKFQGSISPQLGEKEIQIYLCMNHLTSYIFECQ